VLDTKRVCSDFHIDMSWLPKAIKIVSDDIGRPKARITFPTEANVVRVRIQL
jgi:hypothetical protein